MIDIQHWNLLKIRTDALLSNQLSQQQIDFKSIGRFGRGPRINSAYRLPIKMVFHQPVHCPHRPIVYAWTSRS